MARNGAGTASRLPGTGVVGPWRAETRPEVRRAIGRFVVLNVLALFIVVGATVAWSFSVARDQAVRGAAQTARSIANGMVAPLCTPALRAGDPTAIAELDRLVFNRMRDGSILRIKVWDGDGRILYSDAPSLIGDSFQLEAADRALLGTNRAIATISTLSRPENGLEAVDQRRLVETYVGIRDTLGAPLLFEAYFPIDRLNADARMIAWNLTPMALLTIVALQLLQLPLALVLARRLDQAHSDRRRLLEHAVNASDVERRRIAQDLHDGVVQDLAGVGYMLSAIELQLPDTDERLRHAVGRAAGIVQDDVRALRQAMVDLYPPDLAQAGLEAAVTDLVGPLREAGVRCRVRIPDSGCLPELAVQLFYRSARELLRNVAKHANARAVSVALTTEADRGVLTVTDDGVGFQPGPDQAGVGHFGLRLLEEAVRDVGGQLTVIASPDEGTTVRVAVPVGADRG
jgi:signal transduction histidine kinase